MLLFASAVLRAVIELTSPAAVPRVIVTLFVADVLNVNATASVFVPPLVRSVALPAVPAAGALLVNDALVV